MEQCHERRYAIQSHEGYFFYTGVRPNNEQVLMGLFCANLLVAFHYDLEGNLLRIDQRPIPLFQGVKPPYDKRIPLLIEEWQTAMGLWQTAMGLQCSTIKVKKFFSHELHIGIEDYPSHFHEILSDPASDDGEKADVRESMELWDKDGQFVLLWENDYWLDESGEVVSS